MASIAMSNLPNVEGEWKNSHRICWRLCPPLWRCANSSGWLNLPPRRRSWRDSSPQPEPDRQPARVIAALRAEAAPSLQRERVADLAAARVALRLLAHENGDATRRRRHVRLS